MLFKSDPTAVLVGQPWSPVPRGAPCLSADLGSVTDVHCRTNPRDVLVTRQMSPARRGLMQTSADTLFRRTAGMGQSERFVWCPPEGVPDAAKSLRCWRKAGEECDITGEVWGRPAGQGEPGPPLLLLLLHLVLNDQWLKKLRSSPQCRDWHPMSVSYHHLCPGRGGGGIRVGWGLSMASKRAT